MSSGVKSSKVMKCVRGRLGLLILQVQEKLDLSEKTCREGCCLLLNKHMLMGRGQMDF